MVNKQSYINSINSYLQMVMEENLLDHIQPGNFVEYNANTTKKYGFLLPPYWLLYPLHHAIALILPVRTPIAPLLNQKQK